MGKHQTTSIKSQIIFNDQNSKLQSKLNCFGHSEIGDWNLFGIWNLEFGI
jgi:hypothetical protein